MGPHEPSELQSSPRTSELPSPRYSLCATRKTAAQSQEERRSDAAQGGQAFVWGCAHAWSLWLPALVLREAVVARSSWCGGGCGSQSHGGAG